MALPRSTNPAVRRLAHRLVVDHTKSLNEGARVASSIGVEVPRQPEPSMAWEFRTVSSQRGGLFERSYSSFECTTTCRTSRRLGRG